MQPKFKQELGMASDGKLVRAEGPVALNGTEREAYIAVWITQDEVTGMGIGEKETEDLRKAAAQGLERIRALHGRAKLEDIAAQGPQWDQLVEVREGALKEGPAKALAWIRVFGETEADAYDVAWSDEVTLVDDPELDVLERSASAQGSAA